MRLSKKSRYGIRALIDLSVSSKTEHVALGGIAERNNISPQYLEQVFASLRRAGIVKSLKGPQGGYLLNQDADSITISQIIEALEGTYHIDPEEAPENSEYKEAAHAIQSLIIDKVNDQLDDILQNLTLADLERDYLERKKYDQDMYYI